MKFLLLTALLGVAVAMATAHFAEYPFKHKNDGRYGAAYPYANYGPGGASDVKGDGAGYGNGYGYGFNNEFTYRGFGAYPVHVGGGNFYYLGKFNGKCSDGYQYGFYFAGDANSFIVCDHGQAHRFSCPKGTQNQATSDFLLNRPYGLHELCGVNTNQ